jgi:hypothetical protein
MTTDRQKTLNTIKTLVATKHVTVDPEVYAEWVSTFDRVTPDLLTASPADFQQQSIRCWPLFRRAIPAS